MRTRALLPDKIMLPGDISKLVNEVYDENYPLPEIPNGYDQAKNEERQKEDELQRGANAYRIHGPNDDFSSLLICDIPPDDEHARAQVRAGDMSMDALLLAQLPTGDLSLLPWLRNGESWGLDRCPSSEDARKLLAQRINLTSGLLRALERELSWEGLMDELKIPEAWKDSVWLKRAHILTLDNQLSRKIGSLILTYSEKTGLRWEKEGDKV